VRGVARRTGGTVESLYESELEWIREREQIELEEEEAKNK